MFLGYFTLSFVSSLSWLSRNRHWIEDLDPSDRSGKITSSHVSHQQRSAVDYVVDHQKYPSIKSRSVTFHVITADKALLRIASDLVALILNTPTLGNFKVAFPFLSVVTPLINAPCAGAPVNPSVTVTVFAWPFFAVIVLGATFKATFCLKAGNVEASGVKASNAHKTWSPGLSSNWQPPTGVKL